MVLLSLVASLFLSNFPQNRPNLFLIIPAIIASIGTVDTIRCMQRRWSFYHGGVLLLIYMDLMALCMILFLFLYPWGDWIK